MNRRPMIKTRIFVPALPSWLIEPLWAQFDALLPARPVYDPAHPLGCHRRRISDRIVFDWDTRLERPISAQPTSACLVACAVAQVEHQVPCLLGDPTGGRMGGDTQDMDATGGVFHDRKAVQPVQRSFPAGASAPACRITSPPTIFRHSPDLR